MRVLVDTNILLRRAQPSHEHYRSAINSVGLLLLGGAHLFYTPQNMAEFWCVATLPVANNGLGFTITQVSAEMAKLEGILALAPDSAALYPEWKRMVIAHNVRGVQVHDTRLVASMNVNRIERLLTFNTADFLRSGIDVLHPLDVK
jgi:predicted nucleic acid-binding protein